MKSLKDLINTGKKALATTALVVAPFVYGSGQSQLPEHSLNAAMIPYSQPNMHIANGLDSLDYHGSGSHDGKVINQESVNAAMTGVYNYRLDVDGDIDVDQNDVAVLQKYVNGETDHLPGHWNKLNGIEKRHWLNQYLAQSKTKADLAGTNPLCGGLATQECFNSAGIEKPELVSDYYNLSENGRWNIPMYLAHIENKGGVPHTINATLVGPNTTERFVEDPKKLSNYMFSDAQYTNGAQEVVPGDYSISETGPINIEWYGYNERVNGQSQLPIVNFDLDADFENSTWNTMYLVLTNPNAPKPNEAPVLTSNLVQNKVEYATNLNNESLFPEVAVSDDTDSNPTMQYSFESTQASSGAGKFRYSVKKTTTATDKDGASSKLEEMVSIDDTTAPKVEGMKNETYEYSTNLVMPNYATASDNGEIVSFGYTESSTQKMDGTKDQVNYTVTRTHKAVDGVGLETIASEVREVRDTEAPEFDIPADITVKESEGISQAIVGSPTNMRDNSGLPVTMSYYDNVVSDYSDKKVIEREYLGQDVSLNKTEKSQYITVMKTATGVEDIEGFHKLQAFSRDKTVELRYFADANESVSVQVVEAGSGRVVGKLEEYVTQGENVLNVPTVGGAGVKVAQVVDSDKSNVQVVKYVDLK